MCFQYSLSGVKKWLQVHDEIVVYGIFSSSMRKLFKSMKTFTKESLSKTQL